MLKQTHNDNDDGGTVVIISSLAASDEVREIEREIAELNARLSHAYGRLRKAIGHRYDLGRGVIRNV